MGVFKMNKTDKVTRFEVINHCEGADDFGRILVKYGVKVELSYQDEGKTLKVFLTNQAIDSD